MAYIRRYSGPYEHEVVGSLTKEEWAGLITLIYGGFFSGDR